MLTDAQKLTMIADICRHPGAFHWNGRQIAWAIQRVLECEEPIPYELSDLDKPIPYELAHDAVYEELVDENSP